MRTGVLLLGLALPPAAAAQDWNTAAAEALVARAVARRQQAAAVGGLASYHARAEGFVLFLAQVGAETSPRLVKADQLAVEVYWEAPNRSKQIITRWRDRAYLPTDIRYHRDHLGIVTNDFGDLIRLGDGDEVRDVAHPLAAGGPRLYDYRLGDSLVIQTPAGLVTVREVAVRPRDASAPLVAGSLFLDVASAAVVRFRFSFSAAAYLQPDLAGISVVLENALFEGRHWLPYRQEIEIRRRTAWLEFPFETVIRGRWDIEDYDLGAAIPRALFAGPPSGGLRAAQPDDSTWDQPMDAAVNSVVGEVARADMAEVRREVQALVGQAALMTEPPARLAFGSLSELARVNRVQGLALGLGATFTVRSLGLGVRPTIGYGTADQRVTGGLALTKGWGLTEVTLRGRREIRDLSDLPPISGVLNSLMAQEGGNDHGDYVLMDRAEAEAALPTAWGRIAVTGGVEWSTSIATMAEPASGSYRPNPALGAGSVPFLRAVVEGRKGGKEDGRKGGWEGEVSVEIGSSERGFSRALVDFSAWVPAGAGALRTTLVAGIATGGTPAYRTFILGGRGTLVGEPFRAYGGRQMALARVEWRLPIGVPAMPLGSFATTGGNVILAPFVAAGWAGDPVADQPWKATSGIRPVVGVASELLFRMIRIEAGWAIRGGGIGLVVDASPAWWPIL